MHSFLFGDVVGWDREFFSPSVIDNVCKNGFSLTGFAKNDISGANDGGEKIRAFAGRVSPQLFSLPDCLLSAPAVAESISPQKPPNANSNFFSSVTSENAPRAYPHFVQ